MTDFDLLFARLRGLTWSHVAMAAACFVFATVLYVSPAWGYADLMRLHRVVSWFAIAAGSMSVIGAFASRAPWSLHIVEPAAGVVLLLGGLWTLNFPFAAQAFASVVSFVGIFLALYMLLTAVEMDRRGHGRAGMQVALAAAIAVVSLVNLLGFAGVDSVLWLSALELYLAAWGFVYATVSLSVVEPLGAVA